MASIKSWVFSGFNRQALLHSVQTAVAATVSLALARLVRLPEAYWAAITTLIVMQSTLGAALTVSRRRLEGTALGAVVGALVTPYLPPHAWVFGALVLAVGLISAGLHLDRTAYRFASITLAIVMLVVRTEPAWVVATHRFAEVALGILVGLVLTAVWPEAQPSQGP
jgi:uncharacterized membrane protein YccC